MKCTKKTLFIFLTIVVGGAVSSSASAIELIIGEERTEPGIIFIFEGAIKDTIYPAPLHLPEKKTDVHIEARVNWDAKNIPKGAVVNGFIPYLDIVAVVTNVQTKAVVFADLLPHLNLVDNFHYARNIALPGKRSDKYDVTFTVLPPRGKDLGLHKDWVNSHGKRLLKKQVFNYKNIDFNKIAKATR